MNERTPRPPCSDGPTRRGAVCASLAGWPGHSHFCGKPRWQQLPPRRPSDSSRTAPDASTTPCPPPCNRAAPSRLSTDWTSPPSPGRPGLEQAQSGRGGSATALTAKGVSADGARPERASSSCPASARPPGWRCTPTGPIMVTLLAMKTGGGVEGNPSSCAPKPARDEKRSRKRSSPKWPPPTSPDPRRASAAAPGAFVIRPSKNERALESFNAPGVEVSVETETVAAPDDGQSSDGDLPPGGKKLAEAATQRRRLRRHRGTRRRCPTTPQGSLLVYTWIFAGRAADGAAPRIRLSASGPATHAAAVERHGTRCCASWRPRPIGVR